MRSTSLGAALAALVLGACADAPTATGRGDAPLAARASARPTRPMSGRCENTFTIQDPVLAPDGTVLKARTPIRGTCQIAHLGRTEVFIDQTTDLTVSPIRIDAPTVIYTAANGDQLRAAQTGIVTEADAVLDRVSFVATHVVTGGTGRFADARGTLTLRGGASRTALTSFYSLEGEISY